MGGLYPQSSLKASSHVRMFVPTAGPPRSDITDIWLTPSSPHVSFTTETLGYIADCWHRGPENALPYATWSNANIVSGAHQRAEGILTDTEIGRNPSTYWYPTPTLSLEIKRLLPPGGVRWLFVRASAGQGGEKWAHGCRNHDFRPRYGSGSSQPSDLPRHRKYRSSEAGTAIVQREALICIL